mmetsp:Transcript_23793/g.31109  ORF Transcript_23793/g.31109 Transcript_23793/m.31109 type:complete len:228 (+) Transcript_23793:101-784(+)|eukprot:CAMPEP_0117752238 /NCGR_PEP_ID=MMETSP0947-20121206/11486_1 /TAXON_ID=44440 /ORGANISM="Chattonella subsalsa, Strain CCMP2191" /LENGTH=227 /DNA_ID=CAMNT_0005570841 /DNA_START=100 /DNA_END=783 /DNA_ORIENTATION=+
MMQTVQLLSFVLLLSSSSGFIINSRLPGGNKVPVSSKYVAPSNEVLMSSSEESKEGLHGTGSRFLSVIQLKSDEVQPRIVQIAGVYPGLTIEEFNAPVSSPPAERGMWQYDFTDPDGPQMGTVALPGSDIVDFLEDPVIVIATNKDLGIELRDEETEVLVTIDRALKTHQPLKFYAWKTPDKQITIRWFDEIPPGYEILGQVMIVTIPHLEYMGANKSGFLEADEYV